MIIQFNPTELEGLRFEPVARKAFSTAYLEERERVWQAELEKCQARGDRMWNGEIYTIEEIHQSGAERLVIRAGTCEFKDVVFRHVRGSRELERDYGEGVVQRIAGVAFIPLTRDGKYVFGLRGDYAMHGTHPHGLIGGTLNKDEQPVTDFASLRAYACKEAGEETRLEFDPAQVRFVCLGHDRHMYSFLFTARLAEDSREVVPLNRPGEFSCLAAFSREEALAQDGPVTWGFRFWREHLNLIATAVT